MNKPKSESEFRSRVYTDRPAYADFDAPAKFQAIESIIAKRLVQHPNAICSYSGGSDSDIMIDLIERVRQMFNLAPVDYVFLNTGLEMQATMRHVREQAVKYGVSIKTVRPKIGIVRAVHEYGMPFFSKKFSDAMGRAQQHGVPLSIAEEYQKADDKEAKYRELKQRYPKSVTPINFICGCGSDGKPMKNGQLSLPADKNLYAFVLKHPIPFAVSARCCDYCKKQPAHQIEKQYDLVITGERAAEGGVRAFSIHNNGTSCFFSTKEGVRKLRPLFYVTDKDKAWYKNYYNLRYSDAYEVYGFKRTGCCGCPISARAIEDLERLKLFEPNLYKAAWNIFGDSYNYRKKYVEYKKERMLFEKEKAKLPEGQITMEQMGVWG